MAAEPGGRPGALRRRLARALLGLTLTAAAVLGFGYWAVEGYVERESISILLSSELDRRLAEDAPSGTSQPGDAIRFFRASDGARLPSGLGALQPGSYDEIEIQQHPYRVLVRETAEGRVYLLHDIGPLATRERQLVILLIVGVAMIGAAAWVVSARLATIALAPLERLGRAIRSLDPARRDARLALEQDQDLRDIGVAFNDHLAALDRMTERELAFAAAVSHELRTHLAIVDNTVELVELKTPDAGAELRRIGRAARRARDDLEALLAMTRPQALAVAGFDLGTLLRLIADDVAAGEPAMPRIEWRIVEPAAVVSSANTVAIIFSNLLRNAVLAAGAAGRVRIDVDARGFAIADDGPGFPAGDWARLFEPWFEGRNGGSGLGLFIAHRLSARLGGQLHFAPAAPHGLVARLELPARAAAADETG